MKIAILTSGGDAPGMNACIINLINYAKQYNNDVYLVQNGLEGLLDNQIINANNFELDDDYLTISGSKIKSSRSPRFINEYQTAILNLNNNKIDCLIIIGGNGSYKAAKLLSKWVNIVFIPATIDNDVNFSDYSIGYSSACQEIVNQAKKLRHTFKSHNNIIFLEIMGRHCNDLLNITSKAILPDLKIDNQNKLSADEIVNKLIDSYKLKKYALVLVVEHIYNNDEKNEIIAMVEQKINCNARYNILGHTQRGADVNYIDLLMSNLMAEFAIKEINNNKTNFAIFTKNCNVYSESIKNID